MEILCIRVHFSAVIGGSDRIIIVQLKDSGGTVIRELEFDTRISGAAQKYFECAPGLTPHPGSNVTYESLPHGFYLLPGQSLRIYEDGDQDANDDMKIYLTGRIS